MKQKYKGILGLNTVKAFIVILLSLAIIAIVTLIVLGALENAVTTPLETTTFAATNTVIVMNSTQSYTISQNANCKATLTSVTNASGTSCAGNYTVSSCTVSGSSVSGGCLDKAWLLTGSYTDTQPTSTITRNVSTGITSFFANASTYFALLGVVVIILIISLVVVVVNRFGGEAGGSQESL